MAPGAQITPTSVNDWFTSYTSFIDTFADLAQQNKSKGVTMLSVGCELNSMEQYTQQWDNVIASVRSRYTGQLTYAANFSATSVGSTNNVGGYATVPWWNKLDAVGIDAYFPLTNTNNPTESQLQTAWNGIANNIQSWRTSQNLSQKVIFTEVGYQSADGSNQTPWGTSGTPTVDQQEQSDCYQALLTTMSSRSWYDGQFWWAWSTDPLGGYSDPTGFTPQQKSVQNILAAAYGGKVPSIHLPGRLINSFENGLQGFAYSGFGFTGTTVGLATKNATNGQTSLAITAPKPGFDWAATVDLNSGASGFDNFLIAAHAPKLRDEVRRHVRSFLTPIRHHQSVRGTKQRQRIRRWLEPSRQFSRVQHQLSQNNPRRSPNELVHSLQDFNVVCIRLGD